MRILLITTAAIVMTTTGVMAFGDETIDANQRVQANRIENGRSSGDLTLREYRQLQNEQARIAEMERAAKADGHVSRREYRRIHDAQMEAYRHVDQEAHDGQISYWRRWFRRSSY